MALRERLGILVSCLKGLAVAVLATLAGICVLSFVVMTWGVSDTLLTIANQVLKIIAILAGARVAVGRGQSGGAAKGAITGLTYMVVGYLLYARLGNGALSGGVLAGEFLTGAVVGALGGALVANMKPARKRPRARGKIAAV